MTDDLHIHSLSLTEIDTLIQQTRSVLSDDEKKNFTDELSYIDSDYMQEIQSLIDKKLKE